MRFKNIFMFFSFLMIFSSFAFGFNSAEASTKSEDSSSTDQSLSQETIDLANDYIILKDNQFEIKDEDSLLNKIGEEEFSKVTQEIDNKNLVLNDLTKEEIDNTSVSDDHVTFNSKNNEEQLYAAKATSKGKNAIEMYWWGYKVFLNDNLTSTTYQALAGGAGAATLVGIWSPWFSAPTAVVKAVASSAALVLGGSAAMFYNTNKGKGVYLRFTGIVPAAVVYTGMFAQ